jgi:NAD(P)-dependent dehydrogenase (short-subunit alcohol dehydrogenase family)
VTTTTQISELLRQGLLEGVSMLVAASSAPAADEAGSLGAFVAAACAGLGAQVRGCSSIFDHSTLADGPSLEEAGVDDAVNAALSDAGKIDLLVVDGAGLFARDRRGGEVAQDGARVALRTCLDAAWNVTRAVANLAFLRAQQGGRVLYLAPAPDAGEHADAARAGLENLGRTLSIEWARHGITAVTVAPGVQTSAGEVAAVVAYLASPAGAYFSGCLLDLRGPAGG